MKKADYSEPIIRHQIQLIRFQATFMSVVALLVLFIGVLALVRFGRSPHTDTELLRYAASVIHDATVTRIDANVLSVQLQEVLSYYLAALRCALWALVGSGICLLFTCYCALQIRAPLRGQTSE